MYEQSKADTAQCTDDHCREKQKLEEKLNCMHVLAFFRPNAPSSPEAA